LYKLQPCRPQLSKFRGFQAQEQPAEKAAHHAAETQSPPCFKGK
jgi:hypothetical protein